MKSYPFKNHLKQIKLAPAALTIALLLCLSVTDAAIRVTDSHDEGQDCWKIETPTATYFYHKEGAGFSSIVDLHGNDWIDYHPWGGKEGAHRGIPNMVFQSNGNFFHPGHEGDNGSVSTLHQTDSSAIIESTSRNHAWAVKWEIFETHATMTVTKVGGTYWFLYEGTPGGGYDVDEDWYLLSDGTRKSVSEDTVGDIANPEWIVFGEEGLNTVFFVAHHQDDAITDTYLHWWEMTVFGFGRGGRDDYTSKMTESGHQFSIGFLDTLDTNSIAEKIQTIIQTNTGAEISSSADKVEDIDGNSYETVEIGGQVWMKQNLRTTHFNDGTPIPVVQENETWTTVSEPACSRIQSHRTPEAYKEEVLYNGYAATHEKLCPTGWRVATDEDWKRLEKFIGLPAEELDVAGWRGDRSSVLAGSRELWVDGDLKQHDAFGMTGFEALPTGNRIAKSGTFGNTGTNSYFWTASESEDDMLWTRTLYYGSRHMIRRPSSRNYGMAIRCIKE